MKMETMENKNKGGGPYSLLPFCTSRCTKLHSRCSSRIYLSFVLHALGLLIVYKNGFERAHPC